MRFFSLILIATLVACSSSKNVPKGETQIKESLPSWLISRPISDSYYVGISRVSKSQFPENYTQEARKNALNDMSSELEAKVESNSILYTFERAGQRREDFVESIKLSSSADLVGYEQVDAYETESVYAVYYRLSKAKYQQERRAKENKLITESKNWLIEAGNSVDEGVWQEEIKYLVKALEIIQPVWNRPLKTTMGNTEVFYGEYLIKSIQQSMNKLEFSCSSNSIRIPYGVKMPDNLIQVKASVNGNPETNLMVEGKIVEIGDRQESLTDSKGTATLGQFKTKKSGTYNLLIAPNWKKVLDVNDNMIGALENGISTPKAEVKISSETPKVSISVKGEPIPASNLSFMRESIRKQSLLNESNPSNADVIVGLQLTSRKGGEFNGLFTTYISVEANVTSSYGEVLYYEKYVDLKGVDLDYDKAKAKALQSLEKKFSMEIAPGLKKKLTAKR